MNSLLPRTTLSLLTKKTPIMLLTLFIVFCFFFFPLHAQYRGVVTSQDHAPGNVITTDSSPTTLSSSGITFFTQDIGETISRNHTLSKGPSSEPLSRSYYLWAEKTGSTSFAGGYNEILLSALTINGYEDVTQISVVGPKPGVDATRWDLPLTMTLSYSLSTGTPITTDGSTTPTTASPYARTGTTAFFDSTATLPPQVGFSYRTGQEGAPPADWVGPFTLFNDGATSYSLVPSVLPQGAVDYSENSKWTLSFALQQSSIRTVAALQTFTIFPIPQVTGSFERVFGKVIRSAERTNPILPTYYYEYDFEADPAAFPNLTLSATNGFPTTKWELVHVKPDGSTSKETETPGTSTSASVDYPPKTISLRDRMKEEGTHYFRLYNRFDNPTIDESSELIMEWKFNTRHIIKIKAHIHEYGG